MRENIKVVNDPSTPINSRGEMSFESPYTHEFYGFCDICETPLEDSEWFEDKEYHNGVFTGRVRQALSSLVCPCCMQEYCVDDSFDEFWHRK